MTQARRNLGQAGEDLVAQRIVAAGWRLVSRNYRTRQGEIDLIAFDGESLAFIEVKSGRSGASIGPEHPELAVGPQKQLRLRRLAREWLSLNRPPAGCRAIRFDVAAVTYDRAAKPVRYRYIENAFF